VAENLVAILARVRCDFPLNHIDLLNDEQKIAREPPIPRFYSGGRFGGGPVNFSVRR
jgi:hypothetical protein